MSWKFFRFLEFLSKPFDTVIEEGDTLLWNCTTNGGAKVNMTWTKDGSVLQRGSSAHVQIMANNSLRIAAVGPGDEGAYQCIAWSGVARHSVQVKLTVRGAWGNNSGQVRCFVFSHILTFGRLPQKWLFNCAPSSMRLSQLFTRA